MIKLSIFNLSLNSLKKSVLGLVWSLSSNILQSFQFGLQKLNLPILKTKDFNNISNNFVSK
jgi:hypothetical protein